MALFQFSFGAPLGISINRLGVSPLDIIYYTTLQAICLLVKYTKNKKFFGIFLCSLPGARAREKILQCFKVLNSARDARERAAKNKKKWAKAHPQERSKYLTFAYKIFAIKSSNEFFNQSTLILRSTIEIYYIIFIYVNIVIGYVCYFCPHF